MKPPPLPPKIVSLLPAATEMVHALGLGSRLSGRSHECDFPEEVRALPACTRSRVDALATSVEIDRQVKERAKAGQSLYEIDTPLLRRLQPGIILTQAQCEVCAVSDADVREALRGEIGWEPRIVTLNPRRFTDLWTDLARLATELGLPDGGKALIQELKGRVADVIFKVCQQKHHPTVVCVEWLDPLMVAGNWVPEMVDLAGGKNLLGQAGEHSPWIGWELIRAANPEILLVMPCGFDLERTRREMPLLTRLPGWAELAAVQARQVHLIDGSAYFNRPGPRLVDAVEMLAEIFHPMAFPKSAHEGKGWERFKAVG